MATVLQDVVLLVIMPCMERTCCFKWTCCPYLQDWISQVWNQQKQVASWAALKLKLIYDRQSVGLSVLVLGSHLWPVPIFLLEIFFRQLRVCYFLAPSLTRGRVCNLLLLLVLANTVRLGSESHGTQDHILLSQFLRLCQPGGAGPRIYIPQDRVTQIYPRALGFLSVASYDSQGYGGGILSHLHMGNVHICVFVPVK
jgi:hypothetical protein